MALLSNAILDITPERVRDYIPPSNQGLQQYLYVFSENMAFLSKGIHKNLDWYIKINYFPLGPISYAYSTSCTLRQHSINNNNSNNFNHDI